MAKNFFTEGFMVKKIISLLSAVMVVMSISACKKIENSNQGGQSVSASATVKETRIPNDFKDVLPDFDFDGEPVETYKEGLSYSFSAKCSKSKFKKYIGKVKDAGFENKASEGEGYYAAYSEGYYTEITLVNGNITVFIKRK